MNVKIGKNWECECCVQSEEGGYSPRKLIVPIGESHGSTEIARNEKEKNKKELQWIKKKETKK